MKMFKNKVDKILKKEGLNAELKEPDFIDRIDAEMIETNENLFYISFEKEEFIKFRKENLFFEHVIQFKLSKYKEFNDMLIKFANIEKDFVFMLFSKGFKKDGYYYSETTKLYDVRESESIEGFVSSIINRHIRHEIWR